MILDALPRRCTSGPTAVRHGQKHPVNFRNILDNLTFSEEVTIKMRDVTGESVYSTGRPKTAALHDLSSLWHVKVFSNVPE